MLASPLSRRDVLKGGAAAGLIVMFGRISTASAAAGSTDDDVESYLRRSGWAGLVGSTVAVAGASLRLDAIQDLGERLAGRDDAFRLLFSGAPGAVAGDSAECSAAGLGTFSLFVAPVGAVEGGVARYEAVVDRSIPLPRNVPSAPASASAAGPVAAAASAPARAPKKGVVRALPKKKKLTRAQRRRRKAMLKKLARKRR